ncbi:hypothetical protein [Paraherbaspirillum soli]|uniref:Glycine-rich protein n=1 Tax=Paraherbaspirillum soli TaxID=631222 RepID=A0ABW0MBP4_9BURK
MKKLMFLWCAAVALILSAGTELAWANDGGGFHGNSGGGFHGNSGGNFHGGRGNSVGSFHGNSMGSFHGNRSGGFRVNSVGTFHGNAGGFHGNAGAMQAHPGQNHFHGRFHDFHGRGRVFIVDPFFWPGYYHYPTYIYGELPMMYVEPGSGYTFYCTDPAGYYPDVQYCPSGWTRVVPDNSPDSDE